MLRFRGGAQGHDVGEPGGPGNENGLKMRVYGTKGGLEWTQADPNYCGSRLGEPTGSSPAAGAGSDRRRRVTRVPPGHPEGYLEGFANIYTEAAAPSTPRRPAQPRRSEPCVYPTVHDGVKGVAFIEACVASSRRNGAWVKV